MMSGLTYLDNFLSEEEEKDLIENIDQESWNMTLSRRTQHYGFEYDYKSTHLKPTTPIPLWCEFIIERLLERGLLKERPDQMIVNEYLPGQGIAPHIDDKFSFRDGIVSVSLGSDIIMEFTKQDQQLLVPLAKRSVLVLYGEARYGWKHGITRRKSDFGKPRSRRISLTFRRT